MCAEIVWNERLIAVICPFAMVAVLGFAFYWYKLNKVRSDNQLKRAMLERGLSAQEMERVLSLGSEKD